MGLIAPTAERERQSTQVRPTAQKENQTSAREGRAGCKSPGWERHPDGSNKPEQSLPEGEKRKESAMLQESIDNRHQYDLQTWIQPVLSEQ